MKTFKNILVLCLLTASGTNLFADVPLELRGTWYLQSIHCGGVQSTKNIGMVYFNLGATSGSRTHFINGCLMTIPLKSINVVGDLFHTTEGTVSCSGMMPGACSALPACGASGIAKNYPFELILPGYNVLNVQVAPVSPYPNPCGPGQSTSNIEMSYRRW